MKNPAERINWIKGVRRVVVKIGSGILTSSEAGGLNLGHIQCLVDDVSSVVAGGYELIIVSSGAIVAGSKKLGFKQRPKSIPEKQAAAAVGQARAMSDRELFPVCTAAAYGGVTFKVKDFALGIGYHSG